MSATKSGDLKIERARVQLTNRRFLFGWKVNGQGFLANGGQVYKLNGDWVDKR